MSSGISAIKHIITVVMENQEFVDSIFQSQAPFMWSLANPDGTGKYAFLSQYYAVGHPSLPNYLALTGGSTFGLTRDCEPDEGAQNTNSIASLLDKKGLHWRGYAESMPEPCYIEIVGDYYPKHNPFVYYMDIVNHPPYCDMHVVPLGDVNQKTGPFYADLKNGTMPNYSFVTPNNCNDANGCPLATGDAWLKTFISDITENEMVFRDTIIFVTFDEGTTEEGIGEGVGGGQVYCAIVGPPDIVKSGAVSSTEYSHYSTLATVEKVFDLGNLGRNDANATPIGTDVFVG
jgi:phosphatidylinositol-3-phosphatase